MSILASSCFWWDKCGFLDYRDDYTAFPYFLSDKSIRIISYCFFLETNNDLWLKITVILPVSIIKISENQSINLSQINVEEFF